MRRKPTGPQQYRQIDLSKAQLTAGMVVHPNLPPPPAELETVPWEAIAGLRPEPRELEDRLGIVFQEWVNDLDILRLAVVDLLDGIRVSLVRHLHSPTPGTEIPIDPAQFAEKDELTKDYFGTIDRIQQKALSRIMDGLSLTPADIAWRQADLR